MVGSMAKSPLAEKGSIPTTCSDSPGKSGRVTIPSTNGVAAATPAHAWTAGSNISGRRPLISKSALPVTMANARWKLSTALRLAMVMERKTPTPSPTLRILSSEVRGCLSSGLIDPLQVIAMPAATFIVAHPFVPRRHAGAARVSLGHYAPQSSHPLCCEDKRHPKRPSARWRCARPQ